MARLVRIAVLACACALALAAAAPAGAARPDPLPASQASVLDGSVMWIWMLERSSGGSPAAIAARARKHGVRTVILKAADAGSEWKQYSPALISELKRRGLNVCGYHFVYGRIPVKEAKISARIARRGDCLLIDAEGQYEGRYVAAQTYIKELRKRIGADYPVGLAPFPYVHFHGRFPYSVFLGPGGAQFNLPQMYWADIGTTVDQVFDTTYTHQRIYKRQVYPLGQAYYSPPSKQLRRFRALAEAYGATGVSWWSWQAATPANFEAIGAPPEPVGSSFRQKDRFPVLARNSRSDMVVWAQQHLVAAGAALKVDGILSPATEAAISAFQTQNGLAATGKLDAATWRKLLDRDPAAVQWTKEPGFVRPRSARLAEVPAPAEVSRPGR